jgi:glycylpeptide N-tetradecanoyltransferase
MSSNDDNFDKNKAADGIIKMLKEAGVSAKSLVEKSHAFWDTQPMAQGEQAELPEGPIVPNKTEDEIRAEPYNMPTGFEWGTLDIMDAEQREELYVLLAKKLRRRRGRLVPI